jgi:hypothetical protein
MDVAGAPDSSDKRSKDARVDSLVREFLDEKTKEADEERKQTSARKNWRRVTEVLVLAICVAAWTAPSLLPPPIPPLSAADLEKGARATVYLASLSVNTFLADSGRLPASLAEIQLDHEELQYMSVTDSVFSVSMRLPDKILSFDSSMDLDEFGRRSLNVPRR